MSSGEERNDGNINTHEYEDNVHIVLERMNPGFIVALCFIQMKRPQGVGVVVEIPDHARHSRGRLLSGGVARNCIATKLCLFTCIVLGPKVTRILLGMMLCSPDFDGPWVGACACHRVDEPA
jgi:hypothetical protein